jgi:hypothetical protein
MANTAQKRYKQRTAHKRQVASHLHKAFLAMENYLDDCAAHGVEPDPRVARFWGPIWVVSSYYHEAIGRKP